jgi:hypothetical protein
MAKYSCPLCESEEPGCNCRPCPVCLDHAPAHELAANEDLYPDGGCCNDCARPTREWAADLPDLANEVRSLLESLEGAEDNRDYADLRPGGDWRRPECDEQIRSWADRIKCPEIRPFRQPQKEVKP